MESTERLVRTWMASQREEEVREIVSDIISGKTTLLSVVKGLGEYLPSEDESLRSKGTDLLSRVLTQCPSEGINRQATRHLSSFFSTKLEDQATKISALKAILPLSSLPTFTSEDAETIFRSLVQNNVMEGQAQPVRYTSFQILDSLVAHHRDALKSLGNEFLDGYIAMVDGEKDPRNLMVAFAIDRVLCIEFDITNHINDLFNIIFCYFPITFRPPPDNPYGITAEDLRLALRSCLGSSPKFGRLAYPLFLEKLYGGSPATKGDILETITHCLPIYGRAEAQAFSKKLWNALKLEIFQPVNVELEEKALEATRALLKVMYDMSDDSSPKGLIHDICTECLELMNEPEKSQAVPATKVVAAFIGTTISASIYGLDQAIPHLVALFRSRDEAVNRPQILTLFCIVIKAISEHQTALLENPKTQTQLLGYKDDALATLISGIQHENSREAAIEGLRYLIGMRNVLSEDELSYVVHSVNEILQVSGETANASSDEALDLLVYVTELNAKIVEDSTLPMLFTSLPDRAPSRDAHVERVRYWRSLRWLEKLCTSGPLFETLVIRLMTKLDLACSSQSLVAIDDSEPTAAYAYSLIKTIVNVLQVKMDAKHLDIPKYIDRVVPQLYNQFFFLAMTDETSYTVIKYARLLDVAAEVVNIIVQSLSFERQQGLAKSLYAAYFQNNPKGLASGFQELPSRIALNPFDASSSPSQKSLVTLLAAPVVAFHKNVFLPEHDPVELLTLLQFWSVENTHNDVQRTSACRTICGVLNKNVENLLPFIEKQFNNVWDSELSNKTIPASTRRAAIQSWVWILKALIVRNHQATNKFVDHLLQLFDDTDVAWDAARAIGSAVDQGDGVLSKRNHAVTKMLFAQKYFQSVLPKLLFEIKEPSSNDQRRRASLVALSTLISSLPRTTYVGDMPQLMPFLIRGLELPDPDIRANIIETFISVCDGADEATSSNGQDALSEHASTLAAAALRNALPDTVTSVVLRSTSLKLLASLPRVIRYDILHPQKAYVLRELAKALDDPNRPVRKEAVTARTAWFLYKGKGDNLEP